MFNTNTLPQIGDLSAPGEVPLHLQTRPAAAPWPSRRRTQGGGRLPSLSACRGQELVCTELPVSRAGTWPQPSGAHQRPPHPGLPLLVLMALILCQKLAGFCFN